MSEKLFEMKLTERERYDGYGVEWQRLNWDDGHFKGDFSASDLCGCPEDAIIGRDIFDAYDFIEAINLGMSLHEAGYTGTHITVKQIKEE